MKTSLALALLSFASLALAQGDTTDEEASEDSSLDLFDDDVESTRKGWSQLNGSLGVTILDADGVYTVAPPGRDPITIINFDRAGLRETDNSYWVTVNWRSAKSRWGMWFGSWRYDVTGSRVWEDELKIPDGPTIPVGASVESKFDATWYILEGTYSFYRSETLDTGIGFGVHTVDLDTTLTARFNIGDQEKEVVSGELDALAPLPNVLGYVHWKFRPRWTMIGRLGWFGLNYDKYSGQMLNAHAMVSYHMSSRWSAGLGYQFVDLELDIDEEEFKQIYDIDFSGPIAFVRFRF